MDEIYIHVCIHCDVYISHFVNYIFMFKLKAKTMLDVANQLFIAVAF